MLVSQVHIVSPTHLSNGVHGQLRNANINSAAAKVGGQNRADGGATAVDE
jgi:hypothetical protein